MNVLKRLLGKKEESPLNKIETEMDNVPERPAADLATSPKWQDRQAYATDPQADPHILEQLVRHDSVMEVRIAACRNPNSPIRVLEEFGGFKTSSPAAEILAEVEKHNGLELWSSVALNPSTPGKVLEQLASLNTPESQLQNIPPQSRKDVRFFEENVRRAVAENPQAPAAVLKILSDDQEWRVRIRVAENRSTPISILTTLSNDVNEDVRNRVAENPVYRQITVQQGMDESQRLVDIVLHVPNEQEQALQSISQLPNRDELIPIVMFFFAQRRKHT